MKVLITGIGGPTPRSIAKIIREKNDSVDIIGVDNNPKAVGFFIDRLVTDFFVIPKATDPGYWPAILQIIENNNIDLAFVQPELEVIAWGNYFLKNGQYPVNTLIPPLSLAESLVDKAIMSELLKDTEYIPKTIKISQSDPKFDRIESDIKFPCWIRATTGSGGLGSLKLENIITLKSWLFINRDIQEFTVSEFLPGRHLANQMLYFDGEYIKGASLECAEYVMGNLVPSGVTGNTSYGRFLNEDDILKFSDSCITYLCNKLNVKPHGVLSFDLKEDNHGHLKVTEINIRHMAYTGIMATIGFDLIHDTIRLLTSGPNSVEKNPFFTFDKPYAFLRDVDITPVIVDDRKFL